MTQPLRDKHAMAKAMSYILKLYETDSVEELAKVIVLIAIHSHISCQDLEKAISWWRGNDPTITRNVL